MSPPPVTICVLCYGDFAELARQTIESIRLHCERGLYRLFVGGNAVCDATRQFLEELQRKGAIDRLILSETNINKCPMMRRLFQGVDTEFIWWLDDDSWISDPWALSERLERAREAPPATVLWGHHFFFGHERDFSYGTDVVEFVETAPWYRGLPPPSWKPGGKGLTRFQGREQGDGRWFFITGGCWFIRTSAVRALDWPDSRLIKRNDDVFLCEALRQQGWTFDDVGLLGVRINTKSRRGGGEDKSTMERQVRAAPSAAPPPPAEPRPPAGPPKAAARGCVLLPTFRDSELLEENYADRPELTRAVDIHVFDDNFEFAERRRVRDLCAASGWFHHSSGRGRHASIQASWRDRSDYNRFIWESFCALGEDYDYVIKMDTDAYVIDPRWHEEFADLLAGEAAIAGTREMRRTSDVMAFWSLAREAGYEVDLPKHVMHVQGGIYGLSQAALARVRDMDFLDGDHAFFGEDCYISYCCRLLDVEFRPTKTVGSWWHPYRPKLPVIREKRAIHPLRRREWQQFLATEGT